MECRVFTCSVFLGSVCICASCCITILSPLGDSARCRSCGSGTTPVFGSWKAENAAASCGWFTVGWWGVVAEGVVSMFWYTVSILVPIWRTYFPMHFLTDILLCIKIVMQSCSHTLSGVENVKIFCPLLSVRSWSISFPPSTQMALSPRSFIWYTLVLSSMICVLWSMVATPAGSSSDAY